MPGDLLTSWTIRLALVCYVVYVGGWLAVGRKASPRWTPIARWLWTAGCGLFIAHVACAFQFHHHWSHAAAWLATAVETDALLGVRFGDGIYFSYLFLLIWAADVMRIWVAPGFGSKWLAMPVHAYLFFIALNGAIVFEGGPTRWGGIMACLLLAVLAGRAAYNGLHDAAASQVRMSDAELATQSDPVSS